MVFFLTFSCLPGNHETLLQKGGVYAALVKRQLTFGSDKIDLDEKDEM
jgi:hypothetical protein